MSTEQKPLRCIACNRPLIRAAAKVGKHSIGPKCLRKVVLETQRTVAGQSSKQGGLFDGSDCYFDRQGQLAHIALGVAHA